MMLKPIFLHLPIHLVFLAFITRQPTPISDVTTGSFIGMCHPSSAQIASQYSISPCLLLLSHGLDLSTIVEVVNILLIQPCLIEAVEAKLGEVNPLKRALLAQLTQWAICIFAQGSTNKSTILKPYPLVN